MNKVQIATISSYQMKYIIANIAGVNNVIPVNDFISVQTTNGLYAYRYKNKYANLWIRSRIASQVL